MHKIKTLNMIFFLSMSKQELKIAMYGTLGISAAVAGGMYYCFPFLKRMMTHNPSSFMNTEHLAKMRANVVYTDIPIPMDPEEDFDNEILIEWYNDQKDKVQ